MEQTSERPKGSELLGEIRTRIVDGEFVDDIVPLQRRSAVESRRMQQWAEEHKTYRTKLYKRYALSERIADLNGEKYVKSN